MVKYSVCTFAIKLSFFFLDVKGLVFIAKKPVMPKDVSVSFDLSFTLLVRSILFEKVLQSSHRCLLLLQ